MLAPTLLYFIFRTCIFIRPAFVTESRRRTLGLEHRDMSPMTYAGDVPCTPTFCCWFSSPYKWRELNWNRVPLSLIVGTYQLRQSHGSSESRGFQGRVGGTLPRPPICEKMSLWWIKESHRRSCTSTGTRTILHWIGSHPYRALPIIQVRKTDRPVGEVFWDVFNLPQLLQNLKPFMAALKPQNNGPLYSNKVIGTLAVDHHHHHHHSRLLWVVKTQLNCYIWYSEEGPRRAGAVKG